MRTTIAVTLAVVLTTCPGITLAANAESAYVQKTVLITGASSGIGRLTAERLARSGYFVYAGARKQSDIEPGNYATQIGDSRCKQMLATQEAENYRYFADDMQRYLDSCRERLESDEPPSAPAPVPVAEAIEHALFAESPKEHYLVVSDPFEAQITIGKAIEELLQLNHNQPYTYSREDLIKMMDSEAAIVRGDKPRGMPGEI